MKKRASYIEIAVLAGILILIFDSKTAIRGAQDGINLCIQSVIPSLFPFLVLTSRFVASDTGFLVHIFRPIGKLCNIPKGSESILLSGFLGGYPIGAKSVADAYHAGQLSRETAHRMLSFCSNIGPAFLFGIVSHFFENKWIILMLWFIPVLSAILCAQIFKTNSDEKMRISNHSVTATSDFLLSSVRALTSICGWIVLFRIIISFLEKWILWTLPLELQTAVIGFLELSNGCYALDKLTDPNLRFVLCAGILSGGGLCVALQTYSVIGSLSIVPYLSGKLLQCLFSVLISIGIVYRTWIPFLVLFCVFWYLKKKDVAFYADLMYNKANISRRLSYVVSKEN